MRTFRTYDYNSSKYGRYNQSNSSAAGLDTKVWVGGAVLTQEYADMIGADKYCKDALSSVTYANEFSEINKN